MSKEHKHFIKSTIIVAACAFLSRVLGLIRATLLASFYGATESRGLADCYSAAFKLPDIIFNLVAFGAISIVLIPYFSKFVKHEDAKKLHYSCSTFLNFFFLFISFFLIAGFFFADYFVRDYLVKGWTNEENILITIKMTRILLLQVLFMTLSGIFGSYLNALEKFRAYSFALLSYNVGIIIGILAIAPFLGIEGVAWGAVLGSFLHFIIQFSGALVNGYKYHVGLPKFNKEIRQLILIAIPRIGALSLEQLVKFFIVNFASFLFIGSIFIFENAENFSMVPFGMIAVSISTTTFPIFSKLFVAKEYDTLLQTLLEKLQSVLFFMLPIAIIMIVLRVEIIDLLLAYRKFSYNDVVITANALGLYMLGIPFFSLSIVIVKFYYAQKKSFIPMLITIAAQAATIGGCYYFSKKLQVSGLSLGRSIGYIIQMVLLIVCIYIINKKEKKFLILPTKPLVASAKIIVCSILILGLGYFLQKFITFTDQRKLNSIIKLFVFGGVLSLVYGLMSLKAGVPEMKIMTDKILRKLRIVRS